MVNNKRILEEEETDMIGPPISKEEFENAFNSLSHGKATGVDNIPAEMLKEVRGSAKEYLYKLIKDYYEE